eukprot:7386261-Ditylum_brightwellii.AAC.1
MLARNKINNFVETNSKYKAEKEAKEGEIIQERNEYKEAPAEETGKELEITNGTSAKRSASTMQRLQQKKANYGMVSMEMEEAKEKMKDGRTMEDKFDSAIEVEEAPWVAAEETEQK